ncbi:MULTISPECIES: hypothetical protein [unclassified Acinetobacter]|uniref:hypothetical protein n=1 Tax=unclassified Acinetobacter TaxID=196816 RepID=UPI0015D3C2AA|nr:MULTISPECIES: hypothetical protein [unclassified Acinetobacter]
MLQFTDLNNAEHTIHLANMTNVVYRKTNDAHVITFHMLGNHIVPATVDSVTAARLIQELGEHQ